MSDLLIHVGYPKTATTTLQEALFSYLHSLGHINYLGITVKDDPHFNAFYNLFSGYMGSIPFDASITFDVLNYQLVQDTKKALSINFSIQSLENYFNPTMLNIISDEKLLIPYFFAFEDIPSRLYALFSQFFDNIKILITIRNQADLMLSLFSELSHIFTRSSNYNTPSKLFFDVSSGISRLRDINFVNMFNYEHQFRSFAQVFGSDNIEILPYEQLKYDPFGFSSKLSSFLNYNNTSLVHECLQSQLNTKVISNGEYRSSASPLLSLFGERIGRSLLKPSRSLNSRLKKYFNCSISLKSLPLIDKLYFSKSQLTIPPFSPAEVALIKNHFTQSNTSLISMADLNVELFQSFDYI